MATTTTDRLNLRKQANGDNPGTWDVDLNAGFDDADDRLFQTDAGDPNIAVQAHYIGQRYLDTDTDLWWTAQDTADPSTWVDDATLIDAEITHPAAPTTLALDYTHGDLRCILEWVTSATVRLQEIGGTDIYVDISGERVTVAGPFTWDISNADHREGAQTEDASTIYYLYIDNLTTPGTPEPIISTTPPDDIAGTKPGYHPTLADHRCVGSVWNNSGSNIQPFIVQGAGWVQWMQPYDRAEQIFASLDRTQAFTYTSQALNIPLSADMVELQFSIEAAGQVGTLIISASDAGDDSWPTTAGPHSASLAVLNEVHTVVNMNTSTMKMPLVRLPIADRTAPAFKYASLRGTTLGFLEAIVNGYRDLWAPRGY